MLSIIMIQSLTPLIIMELLTLTITKAPSLLMETKGLSISIKPIMEQTTTLSILIIMDHP